MTLSKKEKIERLITEIEKDLDQEVEIWLEEVITRLERICASNRGRCHEWSPKLAPIPEKNETNDKVAYIFR